MARPPLSKGEKTECLTFKLPVSEVEAIKEAAAKADMKVSEYLRFSVRMVTTHSDAERAGEVIECLRDAEKVFQALNRALKPKNG